MRLIFSEGSSNYSNYYFPYQVLLVKEEESLSEIYQRGFLPFRSIKDLYYLSRSCRVDLKEFTLSSENKRVLNKISDLQVEHHPLDKNDISAEIIKIGMDFAKAKFGQNSFNEKVLRRIISNQGNYNYIFKFFNQDKRLLGYVIGATDTQMLHYAHNFYDTYYMKQSVGIGMMSWVIQWAQMQGKKHIYLGTAYGKNSLYKAQFSGFEFFDGEAWSENLDKLKFLIEKEKDQEGYILQSEEYLQQFYKRKNLSRVSGILKGWKPA